MTRSHEMDVHDELTRAAADLEGLTSEFEARTRQVERLEALLDAVLDDPDLDLCLVDEDLRVHAVSRGMAARRAGARSAIGRRVDDVAEPAWGDVRGLLASLPDDRWEERRVDGGTLRVRRTTDATGPEAGAMYVVRFVGQ
jgi:hypothetical protein